MLTYSIQMFYICICFSTCSEATCKSQIMSSHSGVPVVTKIGKVIINRKPLLWQCCIWQTSETRPGWSNSWHTKSHQNTEGPPLIDDPLTADSIDRSCEVFPSCCLLRVCVSVCVSEGKKDRAQELQWQDASCSRYLDKCLLELLNSSTAALLCSSVSHLPPPKEHRNVTDPNTQTLIDGLTDRGWLERVKPNEHTQPTTLPRLFALCYLYLARSSRDTFMWTYGGVNKAHRQKFM